MHYSILTVLAFLTLETASAQRIDSLKALLPATMGLKKCDVLYQLAYECIDFDNDASIEWGNKSLQLAKSYGDSLRIVKASRIKAVGFRRLGLIDSSLTVSNYILPIARRNKFDQELKHILNGLTIIYVHKSFYDKALRYSFESLELRKKIGSDADVGVALNNVGLVYFKLEDYDKALDYFFKDIELRNKTNSSYFLNTTLINIGLCYAYKGNYKEATQYVGQSTSWCNEKCSDTLQIRSNFALGLIAYGMKNYAKAEEYFYNSFQLARRLNNEQFQLDNIVYLTQTYVKNGRSMKLRHWQRSLRICCRQS